MVVEGIPFSAFWLRSSVVSVLISLISDTGNIVPHDIKLIFLSGDPNEVACYLGEPGCAVYCTTAPCVQLTPQNQHEEYLQHTITCTMKVPTNQIDSIRYPRTCCA
jgi:hypothetical protein